ncbi:MAG: MBL fold metallo-hydrolase, partial [Desulfuromonadales bacterium]|nr:MBL fold metallo-hydrolase [Desulfuromonadales bacterium]
MIPTQHTLATPYPVGPVHCYSIESAGELVLFDTGPPTPETRAYLQRALPLERLRHVIITHCHIDHYGLVAWLEREYGATVYLPYRDSLKIARHDERMDAMEALLAELGFDRAYLVRFRADTDNGQVFPEFPKAHKIIEEDLPQQLGIKVLACPGHSQSDLVLTGPDWAVTGDVMLHGIFQSPLLDIDLHTGRRFRNYDAYCSSLLTLATLRDKRILPGHRESIEGVDANILFYVSKLLERSVRIMALDARLPVAEQVPQLLGADLSHSFLVYLKASELVFIRDFLEQPELLRHSLEAIGLFEPLAKLFDRV